MTEPLLTAANAQTVTENAPTGDHQAKFVRLLHDQILKLDQAELDFGLYRILNRRRADIRDYLETELPGILRRAVGGAVEKRAKELETQLADLTTKLNAGAQGMGYEAGAFVNGELLPELPEGPNTQKYRQLRQEQAYLQAQQSLSGSEMDQLYLHLLTFFGRYYQGGDFLPVPRRGRARYLAPYGGQDTLFHWRSRGSHYVKTSTELRAYAYTPESTGSGGPKTVRFELKEADTEQNNVKGARRYFVPHPGKARRDGATLTLPFSYRPLTPAEEGKYGARGKKAAADDEGNDAEAGGTVQERLLHDLLSAHTPAGVDADELLKQVRRYARKNTTDYFVHPNLGPFLKAELDAYLVSEYLRPEALQSPEDLGDRFAKYRALREAAGGLIDFLHQLEDFQAQLFEKRKFVLRADYLLPVRLAPEALWPTLLQSEEQLAEWRDLFHLDLTGREPEEQLTALREHPTLVVDTRHHAPAVKFGLLAAFDDIEASLDGVLVHSENYGALRTLEPTYKERVKLIYIDPPYNREGDGFLYKDDFSKDSTWLSMIEERLLASKALMFERSAILVSIDKNEQINLASVMDTIFGRANKLEELIWIQNSTDNRAKTYSSNHEYIEAYAKNKQTLESSSDGFREPKPGFSELMSLIEEINSYYPSIEEVEVSISDLYASHRTEFYNEMKEYSITEKSELDKLDPWKGLYLYKFAEYRDSSGRIVDETEAKRTDAKLLVWRESDPSAPANKQSATTKNKDHPNYRFYKPVNPRDNESYPAPKRGWAFPYDDIGERPSFKSYDLKDRIVYRSNKQVPQFKRFVTDVETNVPKSVINDFGNGEQDLGRLFGEVNIFSNPKPVSLILKFLEQITDEGEVFLDFFAGSGTSGEAALRKSRRGQRVRFALVEMGEYFDTVTYQRIAKVMFSPDWRDGKPNPMPHFAALLGDLPEWVTRSPRLVQVLRLESFEDSLDALELPHERSERERQLQKLFGSQYLLNYMLGDLTQGQAVRVATERFQNPWAYHLRAGQAVDLPETFNLLLGLKVNRVRELWHGERRYLLVRGVQHGAGEQTLVVWRDVDGLDPAAERDWLTAQLEGLGWAWADFDRVYSNADSALPRAESLDGEFKRLMLVRDEAFRALTAGGVA